MTIECHEVSCKYHSVHYNPDGGPFCDEMRCREEECDKSAPKQDDYVELLTADREDVVVDPHTGALVEIKGTSCRYCGKKGMRWERDGEKWVMIEKSGEQHKCEEYWKYKKLMEEDRG